MAASPWIDVRVDRPASGTTVWVRQLGCTPWQATWNNGTGEFENAGTAPDRPHVPWYLIERWRPI